MSITEHNQYLNKEFVDVSLFDSNSLAMLLSRITVNLAGVKVELLPTNTPIDMLMAEIVFASYAPKTGDITTDKATAERWAKAASDTMALGGAVGIVTSHKF